MLNKMSDADVVSIPKNVRMNKSQFLSYVSNKNDLDADMLAQVYAAIVDGIISLTSQGKKLSLTGFGVFSLELHKGHPVQFESVSASVDDYVVLKFSASDVLNKRLRSNYNQKSLSDNLQKID